MLVAMALAATALPPGWPRTCGNRDPIDVSASFQQTFRNGKTKEIAALFGPGGVWLVHGRTLIGQKQIDAFLRDMRQSRMTIELLGNNASFFSKEGWSLTGLYVEHRIGASPSRQDVMEIYSVSAHCHGSAWRIEALETPRQ